MTEKQEDRIWSVFAGTWLLLIIALILALVTSGCAGYAPPACTSRCGMMLQVETKHWTCESFQRLETIALEEFTRHAAPHDVRFARACEAVSGWRMFVMSTPYWQQDGRTVAGVTYCMGGVFDVGDGNPYSNAFTHELGHVVQSCIPRGPYYEKDLEHANWNRDGIFGAVDAVWARRPE